MKVIANMNRSILFWFVTVHFVICSWETNKFINLIQGFIPLVICSYLFRYNLCHLHGAYMCLLSYLYLVSIYRAELYQQRLRSYR
jgi:hypothetical protein